ncbi:MAG TPA: hypothetical protein DCY97_10265 [Marinilabiliales bacterium]|nr:hypothetical protein [Marinilabiliales bacterium]
MKCLIFKVRGLFLSRFFGVRLYYYGARYYAAWLCRFVSVDPLQHKYPYYTPYQYAGNKPITFIDLDGLEEFKVNYEETARKDVTNIAPPIKQNLLPINLDKLPVLNSKEFPKYSISQPNNDAKNPVGSVSKEANITNQDLKIQEKGEKLLENIYYTKGYAYIPFTAKSGTVYEKGDLISVKDRISKYGGENKPTWCNMFARDLMTEIYGEAPYEGDKTAKEFHDYVKEHPEKFVPLTGTFEDTWKNHINKNEFVIFIDDGHVAVGLPTDLLTTKTYPESETSSKTDSVGNVIQSGKDQGMMILSKAWSKNDFKNIKMYKYVPQKKWIYQNNNHF